MKRLPPWPLHETLLLLAALASICGALQGILTAKMLRLIAGLLFYPIGVVISVCLFSGFFYYVFLFFFKRQLEFKRIIEIVVFASVPSVILSVLSPFLPPVQLLGLGAAVFLMIVGFNENLGLPRRPVAKLLGGLFLIYLIFWIYGSITSQKVKSSFRDKASPESIDILEKELKND
jgi:hypothetical protein